MLKTPGLNPYSTRGLLHSALAGALCILGVIPSFRLRTRPSRNGSNLRLGPYTSGLSLPLTFTPQLLLSQY